jgi:hypothetical protein
VLCPACHGDSANHSDRWWLCDGESEGTGWLSVWDVALFYWVPNRGPLWWLYLRLVDLNELIGDLYGEPRLPCWVLDPSPPTTEQWKAG